MALNPLTRFSVGLSSVFSITDLLILCSDSSLDDFSGNWLADFNGFSWTSSHTGFINGSDGSFGGTGSGSGIMWLDGS